MKIEKDLRSEKVVTHVPPQVARTLTRSCLATNEPSRISKAG